MGLGFIEIVIIGVAALVLLGPERIPEIMRHVAKFYVQLRRTSNDFKSAFDHVVHEAETEYRKENLGQIQKMLNEIPANIKSQLEDTSSDTTPAPRSQFSSTWDPPEGHTLKAEIEEKVESSSSVTPEATK